MKKIQSCYRLEQLASLGLPGQIFIPAALQELHHNISSLSNTFFWQDDQENICNIYDEIHNTDTINHFIAALSTDKPDNYYYITRWISNLERPTTSFNQCKKNGYIADFYKTVLIPMGYFNTCLIPVRQAGTNKRLGVLMIHRQQASVDFTEQECRQLEQFSSVLAFGLNQTKIKNLYTTDGWEQGLLVTDRNGKLQHACTMGQKLLLLASSSRFNTSSKQKTNDLYVFDNLGTLINNLIHPNNRPSSDHDPTLTTRNAWGEFKLRGFLITDVVGQRAVQIGLNIRWQEPFVLKLFHRIGNLGLTPRQETVGLLYAAGDHHQIIANKLNLSLYTVKEHVKNISDRLNIRSRAELIELILCEQASNN